MTSAGTNAVRRRTGSGDDRAPRAAGRPLEVVLTHPYCWPYVRRGNERNVDELGRYLTARGHRVTTLSTRSGPRAVEHGDRGRRILVPPLVVPGLARLGVGDHHTFFFRAYRELGRLEADVVHSFLFGDALAAARARGRRRFATVYQMNGVGVPGVSCRRFPPEAALFRRAIASVDARIACSRFVRDLVREHYGHDCVVLPPMVDVSAFGSAPRPPRERPVVLAAGDLTLPRKGLRVLLEAFALLKRALPEAVLWLSGRVPERPIEEFRSRAGAAVARDVAVLGLGRPEDLPAQYAGASVLALPSMWEPSGTVMAEAWAAGTPVVATAHAGLPEFVDERVGVLFEPLGDGEETRNAEGLAEALARGISLSERPGTERACRAHAARFSCEAIGPRIEELYRGLV